MDFGKLTNVEHVDFELPPDPPGNSRILSGPRATSPRVSIGAPIWTCARWVGQIIPPHTPARDFLKHYSRAANSIELNSTFYAIPARAQLEAWRDAVPEGFLFHPKAPQHAVRGGSLREFGEAVREGFGARLGTSFLQLAQQFGPGELPALRRALESLPAGFRLNVEFRHPAWFKDHALRPEAAALLERFGVGTVITDTAGRRDVLHATLTGRRVLIRWVGNDRHPSDFTRLDSWAERLTLWLDAGLEEVAFFVHDPTSTNFVELANHFIARLRERSGFPIRDVAMPTGPEQQLGLFG